MPKRKLEFVLVETEKYGTLHLRLGLLFGDLADLEEIAETELTAREFTVQAVSRFLRKPPMDVSEIRLWNDDLLTRVASTWAREQDEPKWPLPENLSPYEAFRHGYHVYSDSIRRDMAESLRKIYLPSFEHALEPLRSQLATMAQELADVNRRILEPLQATINLMVETALGPLRENISRIVGSFTLEIDVGRLLPALPDLSRIREQYETLERAADVLDRRGYRFMQHQWLLSEIAQFAGVEEIDPRVCDAAITNRLLGLMRSKDFSERLGSHFCNSTVLRRRWAIVQQALDAHQRRLYALSIPTFLAQVEGIFTDALILRETVVRYNGKLCAKGPDGKLKLDKKGRPVELHGLQSKVDNSKFRENERLNDLAKFFTSYLIAERNDVMHGRSTDYVRAKLSVQLVLNIYLLAAEFSAFESGN